MLLPKFRPLFVPIACSSLLTFSCSSVPSGGQARVVLDETVAPQAQRESGRLPGAPVTELRGIRITNSEAASIGQRIWKNECAGTVAGLTSWNAGENFASLGIGHFIWFPAEVRAPYEESFPPLITFMRAKGTTMPSWLASTPDCPWRSKVEFESAAGSARMSELRTFLKNTIPLQVEFILHRLDGALPKMLAAVPAQQRAQVEDRFYAVASTAQGKYALMDYVNFKGEGTNPSERYRGQGWGMLQVLQEMKGSPTGSSAVNEYASAAVRVLTRRVANAPKDEKRWLPGWTNRCNSYRS
ncbi:MAG: hypothetical protein KDN22_19690 [Verrucomicrobiae bacterium]|nr:hypothetical protein [Verrucomicrobiae bacterium]